MKNEDPKKPTSFYVFVVILLMLALPLVSVYIEIMVNKQEALGIAIVGKWFLFWAVGVRLFTAGLKQVLHPAFTAQRIFHLEDEHSFVVVKELGFANICLGLMAMLSLFLPQGRVIAAIGGGLFFGIAGVTHLFKKPATANELVALVSDLFIFMLMAIYVLGVRGTWI